MGKQHHVFHRHQLGRHPRLVREHVEAGRQNLARLERGDQRRLVHHRAPRHVDQDAVGPERLEHVGVDQMLGRGTARGDHHQHVDVARHVDEIGVMPVRHPRLRMAAVIDDGNAERIEPARDRLADAAEPDHAHGAIAQRRPGQRVVPFGPLAGAQIALGLRQLADRAQQQAKRRVGDLLGEHVGRVGDHDAMGRSPFGIDMIVAHPEARDDLEFREAAEEIGAHRLVLAAAGDNRTQPRRQFCGQDLAVGRLPQLVQRERPGDALLDQRHHRPNHQDIELLGGHPVPPSHSVSAKGPADSRQDRAQVNGRRCSFSLPRGGGSVSSAARHRGGVRLPTRSGLRPIDLPPGGKRDHQLTEMYCVSVNSIRPSCAPSRPMPLCFMPPKGAAGSDTRPRLSPTMPNSSRSDTRRPRPMSRV